MPKLELTDDQLIIRLTASEKLAAFHGDVTVNGVAIRGATVAPKNWWTTLGMRIGTGLPGVIIAGTFIKKDDRAFVSWTRKYGQPLEITLAAKMPPRLEAHASRASWLASTTHKDGPTRSTTQSSPADADHPGCHRRSAPRQEGVRARRRL
jgi:hypothetical protein